LKEIGVISFIGRIGTGASRQTYIVHPSQFQHLAVPWKFYTPKHAYTMRQIKNVLTGAILEDVARRTVTGPDEPIVIPKGGKWPGTSSKCLFQEWEFTVELWFEAGEPTNIQFFTTAQLDLLRTWCMTHELPHRHHTR